MSGRRGTAIQDHASDLALPRTPATRRSSGSLPGDPGRFSPLNAPQRALVDAFLAEARPWALRKARRAYGHLPAELHEQAIDQAMVAIRTGAPPAFDRRTLYGELAGELTQALRRVHVGWCLNRAKTAWGAEAVPEAPDRAVHGGHPLARFVDDGLGGLERAVLQLEIGAGRDTASSRAALRLGPRHYQRHRDEGLLKLRAAVAGMVRGRVCEDHADAVTLAATGDRIAADELSAGPARCRACAREATALRRVLRERLALAPWPLAIKPAGVLAAKLGAAGAVVGGKGAGGASLAGAGAAGKSFAAVLAAAAVATGSAAVVADRETPAPTSATKTAERSTPASSSASRTSAATAPAAAPAGSTRADERSARRKSRDAQPKRRPARETAAPAVTAPATGSEPATPPQHNDPLRDPVRDTVDKTVETVDKTVGGARKTVDKVKSRLPVKTDPQTNLPDLKGTLDEVTGTVDGLLKP